MPTPKQILASLKDDLRHSKTISLGQFQVINLDLIKDAAGERWAKLKTKIFDVSEAFIARRIEKNDAIFRCDEGFLVVFALGHADDAETRTREISDALNRFYLGDDIFRMLKVSATAMQLLVDELAALFAKEGVKEDDEPAHSDIIAVSDEPQLPPVKVVYEPVYDVERQGFVASFCLPVRRSIGEIRIGHLHTYPFDPHITATLDLEIQDQALSDLQERWSKGYRGAICLTPHFRTLNNAMDRQRYLAALTRLPPDIQSVVSVRIDGTPNGAPIGRLMEMTGLLRTMRIQTLVQCLDPKFEIERFADCQIQAFGGVMKDRQRGAELSADDAARIEHFVTRAKKLGAGTYAAAVARRSTFQILLGLGVRWFSGPYLAQYERELPPSRLLSLEKLSKRPEGPVPQRAFSDDVMT